MWHRDHIHVGCEMGKLAIKVWQFIDFLISAISSAIIRPVAKYTEIVFFDVSRICVIFTSVL